MPRVLISDSLPSEGLAILERTPGIELDKRTGLKGAELQAAIAAADGVIIRSGTTITADLLKSPGKLKVIVRAGVGVDNIDVSAASRAGIVVMNTPGGNTLSTAEQTMALILAMCRRTAAADASLRAGRWDRNKFVGSQLAGKTLGIIGMGRIGQAVARRAAAFEMKVLGYDPFVTPERAVELGVESVAKLENIYPLCDILTVHVPMGDDTRGLVGSKQLAAMRKGSFVVNCARGGIIDEAALAEAVKSGHLAGAALDVFSTEPMTASPLFELPNVVVTPHLGASTAEAQLSVAIEAAQLMSDYLTTGNVRFAVNMASIDPQELEGVQRHLDIAWRLGLLQAQLAKGGIRKATLEYRGEATKKKTKLITAAFTAGLLQGALEEQVNLVNATILAGERGIRIEENVSTEPSDFSTLIRSDVETADAITTAAGTTRGTMYNRLVRLGSDRLDAYLEGTMLIYTHLDKPGVIGLVGTVLGKHGVNIAQMIVGRRQAGGNATGILALDNEPPTEALEEIRRDERIFSVQVVKLPAQGAGPGW